MTYRLPLVPTVTAHVTEAIFKVAKPNTTGHCIVAEAMRALGYIRVKVTRDTVSVVQPREGYSVRYFWPTPAKAAIKVAMFDDKKQRKLLKPFTFTLDGRQGGINIVQPRPHVRGRGPDKANRAQSNKTAPKCVRRWQGLVQYGTNGLGK